ncbi:MAG TPA: FAD-dependent oxidoreductase [Acidimicrobiales bacterium]|nr:FAD-dependent oxidoreductase [Acidimicrobiales bacterium]
MTATKRDVLIVGAGVIGTTSAFFLARAGWRVTLFDPAPGLGATWAAAGMIAPSAEVAPGEQENFTLQRGALAAWRDVAREILTLTGDTLELFETGTLLVGFDASDRRLVDQFALVAASFGVETSRVTRGDHQELFTGVSPRIDEGLLLGGDAWLDPDQVMSLLTKANASLGVTVVRQQVLTATTDGDHVEVTTDDQTFRGDIGILATGAHSLPRGVAERAGNVVRPVRGMTVRVQGVDRSTLPTLRAFVRGRSLYVVSRPGGYCVLGASSDEQEELIVEVGELQRLLRDALDLVPALESAAIIETRQGLRPASKDLAPFMETVDERWAWLSGHYRHGVTLAPLAALEAQSFAEVLA